MKFLFLKYALNWPRSTGHDVHAYEMAKALAQLGSAVGLATVIPPTESALAGLSLELGLHSLHGKEHADVDSLPIPLSRRQRRFLRYWGLDSAWFWATASLVAQLRPDVVVAANVHFLPLLAAVQGPQRIWYPADEYARHHLLQFKLLAPRSWSNLLLAGITALYERSFATNYDRAWVVSQEEAWAMRWYANAPAVDVVPNGVDAAFYQPGDEPRIRQSCVFWGRLDAGPNIDAVQWFCRKVWPRVKQQVPEAQFHLYGFCPDATIQRLADQGIPIIANQPDLRPELRRHEVAVMPFVSGGGIKNKLLEAAALGMPIIASARACQGLDLTEGLPLVQVRRADEWVASLLALWRDADLRQRLGRAARSWVLAKHTWEAAASRVCKKLNSQAPNASVMVSPTLEVPSCPSS